MATAVTVSSNLNLPEALYSSQEAKEAYVDTTILSQHKHAEGSFDMTQDLHFSEDTFGFEAEKGVDDLLNEFGILPAGQSVTQGEEKGSNSAIYSMPPSHVSPEHRTPSPSLITMNESLPAAQTVSSMQNMERTVSLEKVETFSVPNPILRDPPSSSSSSSSDLPTADSTGMPTQTNQGMKRKLVNVTAEKELSPEELLERRQRNRDHAKKSRQRKKALTVLLKESVEELKRENTRLRQEVETIIGHKQTEAVIAKRRESSREQFLNALMNPNNRVLDNAGLTFMRNLRKNLSSNN